MTQSRGSMSLDSRVAETVIIFMGMKYDRIDLKKPFLDPGKALFLGF